MHMKYHIITNDYYFLVGASSIFKTLGLSFSSEFVSSPECNVCTRQHVDVVVCFFHYIALYQRQLINISELSDCVFLVVDKATDKMNAFPIVVASASLPADKFIATILGINPGQWHYPWFTLRTKRIIDSFYQNRPLSSISTIAEVSEKSVYGIKRRLIKAMGLGGLNSAYGLIIAHCIVILQACYSIRH